MFERIETLRMASEMALHAAGRQAAVAANVANADTPGYRAGDLPSFVESYRAGGTVELKTTRDEHIQTSTSERTAAVVPDQRAEPSPNGNTVSLETELVRSASAKRQHDLSLAIYKSSLDILRASLGRGR